MWAFRRACNPFRVRGLSVVTIRGCGAKFEMLSSSLEGNSTISETNQAVSERYPFFHTPYVNSKFSMGSHGLSSQAGAESSDLDDDLADGNATKDSHAIDGNEDELDSEPEVYDEEDDIGEPSHNVLEVLDTETDTSEKKKVPPELFEAIMDAPRGSVHSVLDKWVQEGKDLGREEIVPVMRHLRRRRMYGVALQLSDWLEANMQFDLVERDYASRLDLIAKVRGLHKAEGYLEQIPKSCRSEVIYRTLLANSVAANNVKKAEEVFNKMKDMEFPITAFACNQMLLLYRRHDKKKIADVLLLMEKEKVSPTLFTYRILIDIKGQSNDITGMEQIVETMKAEGIEPDLVIHAILAKHYVSGGLKGKVRDILEEMEGGNLGEHRKACRFLLPLYGALGEADEVERVWEVCKSNPRMDECMAAIEAWGKLKKIDEAEAVFDMMLTTWKKLSSRHFSTLLQVYANNKMLSKGKDLVKRMADSGLRIGPFIWDALVKLYVEVGEVEKADSMLQKAVQQYQIKPMYTSYMVIMDQYAKRGDTHNVEKMFHQMRQAGYVARHRHFQTLVQTYVNAKSPAYGMRERMKADNIFPNRGLAAKLDQVDAFRKAKNAVSELLD